MRFKFAGKYIITADMEVITGLHIGGSATGFEIGGIDNPVIRNPLTNLPYIPGSSLKGKLRSLLEWCLGSVRYNDKLHGYGPCWCGDCDACILFGPGPDPKEGLKKEHVRVRSGPTRVSVGDALMDATVAERLEDALGKGITTELKTENALNRVTSEANPRTQERVPAGAKFSVEIAVEIYEAKDVARLKSLFTALKLLEDSALGGGGSRGNGKVRFNEAKIIWRDKETFYKNGGPASLLLTAHRAANESLWIGLLQEAAFQQIGSAVHFPDSAIPPATAANDLSDREASSPPPLPHQQDEATVQTAD